ncbi:hypothetical protein F5B19DRAFT_210496 [Rostrohypoxylon terebratum]|nr:hypothetical protein F5B19DRAFT_210496 [Rostrohypoxylon terebratum]
MPSATQDAGATPESRTLGEAINIATRSVHTRLNKLIILRLRLALPPHANDASNYVQGLLHIAPIYMTFETLWQEILETPIALSTTTTTPSASGLPTDDAPSTSHPKVAPRIHAVLAATHFPTLSRSASLSADLSQITGWSAADLAAQLQNTPRESPALAAMVARARETAGERPHALLAYAWVLYMALFAGGRFIRAALERVDVGDRFWGPLYEDPDLELEQDQDEDEDEDEEVSPTELEDEEREGALGGEGGRGGKATMPGTFPGSELAIGEKDGAKVVGKEVEGERDGDGDGDGKERELKHPLSFFRFDTPADGQDLRQAFKARVAEATSVLSPAEIEDVVNEARDIFEQMVGLVGELDDVCGTEYEAATAA